MKNKSQMQFNSKFQEGGREKVYAIVLFCLHSTSNISHMENTCVTVKIFVFSSSDSSIFDFIVFLDMFKQKKSKIYLFVVSSVDTLFLILSLQSVHRSLTCSIHIICISLSRALPCSCLFIYSL